MTVAMALADMTHHTAPHGDRRWPGPGSRGTRSTTRHDERSPPPLQLELFQLFEEELEAFAELWPQERVQRHTMEQLTDVAPVVPSLAVLESQMVDQLVAVIKLVDAVVPGQIIAVPKISWPSRFPRTVLREPQKAEQLVETGSAGRRPTGAQVIRGFVASNGA